MTSPRYLNTFNAGERIRIFIDASINISPVKTDLELSATILIATSPKYTRPSVLLGWNSNDSMMPSPTVAISSIDHNLIQGIIGEHKGWESYLFGRWVYSHTTLALPFENSNVIQLSVESEGHHCNGCNQDYPYARHNLGKGEFVCSGCRLVASAWR